MPTHHGRRAFVRAFEKNMKYKGPESILALFSCFEEGGKQEGCFKKHGV